MKKIEPALTFSNVSFSYGKTGGEKKSIVSFAKTRLLKRGAQKQRERFLLSGVNLTIEHGEIIGVIGRNGAGKSTFLKISAGILFPSFGHVLNKGKIAPIIELGTGFSMDFSARENMLVYGCLVGNSRQEVSSKMDEI